MSKRRLDWVRTLFISTHKSEPVRHRSQRFKTKQKRSSLKGRRLYTLQNEEYDTYIACFTAIWRV